AVADHSLGDRAGRPDRRKRGLSPEALARLAARGWRGNVRELRNVLEQAAVLAAGEAIEESDLNLPAGQECAARRDGATLPFAEAKRDAVESFERNFLLAALRANGGNVSRTAAAIGMVRQRLQQKIRELGLR